MMSYKGYFASVEFDAEAKIFHGEVLGINDVITFQGTSVDELEKELRISVEDYLEFCAKEGKKPEVTLSGNLNLRMGPEKHRMVKVFADAHRISINDYINIAIEEKISREI
ncbi:type II toxin-antitoxin system HicB family antitoxin [Bdellovibrio sp. BCCA]|uniref:type II toxin-antitoxin system HicB family antitoxin n=1 Tax=Bdellovibrio sp. BCCA TaxID=3136281 RepID=UPI0030F3681E